MRGLTPAPTIYSDLKAKRNRIGFDQHKRLGLPNKIGATMAERIYIVNGPQGTRLVKASLRQQALSLVANSTFNVHVATQDELVEALTNGYKVEQYRAPEQGSLPLDGE
jgi:hypothetical protein